MIIDVGPKPADVTLSWENLYSYNRKLLDPMSERFFFVAEPTKLIVKNVPKAFTVRLPLHPEKPEGGFRQYTVTPSGDNEVSFWMAKKDADNMEAGKVVRLMELFNVRIEKVNADAVEAIFVSESYEDVRKTKAQLIQWIPIGEEYPCGVILQDASAVEGFA